MAISRNSKRPLALVVALLFLLSPLSPLVGAASGDGGAGPGEGSFTADEGDDVIPIITVVDGPDDEPFGNSVTNLGDVDGDGLDDMLIGSGYNYWREIPPDIWPGMVSQYLLLGQEDRSYIKTDLELVGNGSSTWSQHSERWLGDVNGDGYADLVYRIDSYVYEKWYDENGEIAPPIYSQYNLFIHYGTEDGFAEEADQVIDIMPDDLDPNITWVSFQFGGVGDVNGDGYNDLFVLRHGIEIWVEDPPPGDGREPGTGSGGAGSGDDPDKPPEPWPEPKVIYYPPDFQLYYGSGDGLPDKPSWNGTPELEERYVYLQGIHHADVNGDGYSDVVLASTTAPHIRVYHGSEDGILLEPDMTVTFNQQFTYGWSLHSPVDWNGDGYDDLVIDYGQSEGLFDYVQYVYVFPGSELGIPTRPASQHKLVLEDVSEDKYPNVVVVDVNGDGLDDVVIYALFQLRTLDADEIRFMLYFNTGQGLPADPSWQYRYVTDFDVPALNLADRGDFDGDGYEDVALAAPGEWIWWDDGTTRSVMGHVVIVNGGGIMDLMRSLTLREGPRLFAGYKDYDFRVNVNPTGLVSLPSRVELVLDPDGANVVLEAGLLAGGAYIQERTDPEHLVDLRSDLGDIVWDTDNNTIWVHFRVMFNWSWPHEDLCDANVRTFLNASQTPFVNREVFWVENDLTFAGGLTATGEHQGALGPGDWVRGGEVVTVSGPRVVYEGTVDVYPPSGVATVVLRDDDGSQATSGHVAGEAVSVALATDPSTDAEETLTLTLQDLPGLATVVSSPTFALGVDADAPTFRNAVPEPDDWHSSGQVLTSITADDAATSGVRASSMEYSYSIDGGASWTAWSRQGLEITANGPRVDGMVLLSLPDGDDNLLRWRATDLVGNGPVMSPELVIKVDTINVTYTGAVPGSDVWLIQLLVECGVTIRDMDGAGIEVASIQYRVSHANLSGYGGWQAWGASVGDAQEVTVRQDIAMGDSAFNYVQWRAKDIAGNGYTTSPHYRVRVDVSPIWFDDFAPDAGPHGQSRIEVEVNVSDGLAGSGVDLASIEYRVFTGGEWGGWAPVGMTGSSAHNRFSVVVTLADGEDNRVQFRGADVAGNGPTESAEHVLAVDTTGPVWGVATPGPEEKQPSTEVTVSITLSDAIAGLDLASVQYRFGTEGTASWSAWQAATARPAGAGGFLVEVALSLAPGRDNVVQFRASDALSNGGESEVASVWVNRVPSASIASPVVSEVYRDRDEVTLNATGSGDPDGDDLNYTWYIDLQAEPVGHGRVLEVNLPVGVYNVTLVVTDDDGAQDTTSVQVTVERYVPPSSSTGGNLWWILFVLILAVVLLATFVIWRRRAEMSEWEEIE